MARKTSESICHAFCSASLKWVEHQKTAVTGGLAKATYAHLQEHADECTFSPEINHKSRLLDQPKAERSGRRGGSPKKATPMPAPAMTRAAELRRAATARNNSNNNSSNNPVSAKRLGEGGGGGGEAEGDVTGDDIDFALGGGGGSENEAEGEPGCQSPETDTLFKVDHHARPPVDAPREELLMYKHKQSKQRLHEAAVAKRAQEDAAHTFKPSIKGFDYKKGKQGSSELPKKSTPAHERLYRSHNSNSAKLEAERKKKADQEVAGCTFAPKRIHNIPLERELAKQEEMERKKKGAAAAKDGARDLERESAMYEQGKRQQQAARLNAKSADEAARERDGEEAAKLSFKPTLETKSHGAVGGAEQGARGVGGGGSGNGAKRTKAKKPAAKVVPGYEEQIARMRAATQEREKKKAEAERTDGGYDDETYKKSRQLAAAGQKPFNLASTRREEERQSKVPALFLDINMGKRKGRCVVVLVTSLLRRSEAIIRTDSDVQSVGSSQPLSYWMGRQP